MNNEKITAFGGVEDGKLKLSYRKQFDQDIKLFEGKRVEITIRKAKKIRTNPQNAWYWGCIIPAVLQGLTDVGNAGLTSDEVHHFLKDRFLPDGKTILIPESGEQIVISKTTTTLSTTEMMDYTNQIIQFAAEMLNVVIPDPTPLFSNE